MKDKITLECNIYNACRTNTSRALKNDGHYDMEHLINISGGRFKDVVLDLQWCAERNETQLAIECITRFAESLLSAYEIQEKTF